MKLNLTTWQRINCVNIIGAIGDANAATFRKAAKLLDLLEMTDNEKEQVSYDDRTATLEGDLLSVLKDRFGIEVEKVWMQNSDEEQQMQRPEDVFITARVDTGQANWKDKDHLWQIEVKDGNLASMLKGQVERFKWRQGYFGNKEWRAQILDLYDQLGIENE